MTEHDPNRDLEAWLRTAPEPQPSSRLQRAIAEIPLRHPRAEGLSVWWPFGSLWKGVAAAVLVCALGVIAGTSSSADPNVDSEAVAADDTWSESSAELAFALPLDEELTP